LEPLRKHHARLLFPVLLDYRIYRFNRYKIEQYVKQAVGRWMLSETASLEAIIELPSIKCVLALNEVYDRVRLP